MMGVFSDIRTDVREIVALLKKDDEEEEDDA